MAKKDAIQFQTGKAERFSYGLYFFGQLIFYGIISQFLQLFMTDSGIPAIVVSGIFIVAKVWDAINDPMFGVIVDKSQFKKGKYLPWIRLSTFLIPLTTLFIFVVPQSVSVTVKAIWIAVGYLLWDTSYTMCDVPIFALATSMTPEQKERDWLYVFNRFFTFVGGIVALLIIPQLYPRIGWPLTVVVVSVIAMAAMLPIGYLGKERVYTKTEKEPSIKELLLYLKSNKYLLIFNGATIIASLTATGGAISNYVAIHCLGSADWISITALLMVLPMLITIIVVQAIIDKIDKLKIYIGSCIVSVILGIVMFFAGYENRILFSVLVVVKTIFSSAAGVLGVMFTADCAEYGHYKTGNRAQGMAFSVQTFTAKITAAVSGAIGMAALAAVGFVEGEGAVQSAATIQGLWTLYTLIPCIATVAAIVFLLVFYKLSSKDAEIMGKCNRGEISREEAESLLGRRY